VGLLPGGRARSFHGAIHEFHHLVDQMELQPGQAGRVGWGPLWFVHGGGESHQWLNLQPREMIISSVT